MNPINVVYLIGAGASIHFGFPDTLQFLDNMNALAATPPPELVEFDHGKQVYKFYKQIHNYVNEMQPSVDIEDIYTKVIKFHEDMQHLLIDDENTKFFAYLFLQKKFKVTKDEIKINPDVWNEYHQQNEIDIQKTIEILRQAIEYQVIKTYSLITRQDQLIDYDRVFSIIKDMDIPCQNISIFTTNYDRVLEDYFTLSEFCDINSIEIEDGFHRKRRSRFDTFDKEKLLNTDKIRLFKLHGSIDRYLLGGKNLIIKVEDPIGYYDVMCRGSKVKQKMLIYPMKNKIDYKKEGVGEFELDQFRTRLSDADLVISLGFSFRDETIKQAVINNHNPAKQAIILISPTADRIAKELQEDIDDKNTNIHPIPRKFPDELQLKQLFNHIKSINLVD